MLHLQNDLYHCLAVLNIHSKLRFQWHYVHYDTRVTLAQIQLKLDFEIDSWVVFTRSSLRSVDALG